MSIKKSLLHALIGAVFASMAALIYNAVYTRAMDVHFGKVLNAGSIVGSTTLGCIVMALAYHFTYKWKGAELVGTLNILIVVLSFASTIGVFGFKLPLDLESPELFPGLAIPMHFFPALSFFSILPFFKYAQK